jgi:putative RNA 2'-phosphotransferase
MRLQFDQGRLISTMAFALRHDPAHFGLQLDEEGWTSFVDLVIAIQFERYDWALIDEPLVEATIAGMDRFEMRDGRIRATYGHSIELGKLPPIVSPPLLLFHGTTQEALPAIRRDGLKPMGRRFVHLTSDRDYALLVANAKAGQTIIVVNAAAANTAGRVFRFANARVWLTEQVESAFLATEIESDTA